MDGVSFFLELCRNFRFHRRISFDDPFSSCMRKHGRKTMRKTLHTIGAAALLAGALTLPSFAQDKVYDDSAVGLSAQLQNPAHLKTTSKTTTVNDASIGEGIGSASGAPTGVSGQISTGDLAADFQAHNNPSNGTSSNQELIAQ